MYSRENGSSSNVGNKRSLKLKEHPPSQSVLAFKRRSQRGTVDNRAERQQLYRNERNDYMARGRKAKSSGSKEVCTNASSPYGKQCKAAFRKVIPPPQLVALYNNSQTGGHISIANNNLTHFWNSKRQPQFRGCTRRSAFHRTRALGRNQIPS
ncbi:hypothetical protein AVEN_173864-1 [Araneus ventricosus]|uniref:Uncharacterized protein n=1 Tax=Araneus ventricosus TaxID=182803 RepID=A0A4Y2I1I7_ARAVE|nr:hypothetical protein AVEN_173864-1 [Araneus ventricosus]